MQKKIKENRSFSRRVARTSCDGCYANSNSASHSCLVELFCHFAGYIFFFFLSFKPLIILNSKFHWLSRGIRSSEGVLHQRTLALKLLVCIVHAHIFALTHTATKGISMDVSYMHVLAWEQIIKSIVGSQPKRLGTHRQPLCRHHTSVNRVLLCTKNNPLFHSKDRGGLTTGLVTVRDPLQKSKCVNHLC